MDLFDISEGYGSNQEAFSRLKCPVMVMGCQTDILFPVRQQRDIARWIKESGNDSVTYFEMDSIFGESFCLKIELISININLYCYIVESLSRTRHIFT